jgi:hypothetical protein
MAWSNVGGTYNLHDMDSSDGTNAKKLVVRNANATATGQYRAEILETTGNEQALHVKGATDLERTNNDFPDQAIALSVKGRTTMGSWDIEHRPQPVLQADGRTELQAHADVQGQPEEYALKVTGRSLFTRQEVGDVTAIKVDGSIQVKSGSNDRGVIKPHPTINKLDINADSGSPDVQIGFNSNGSGNTVSLQGQNILIGTTESGFRTAILGPAVISSSGTTDGLQVHDSLLADTMLCTPIVDARNSGQVLRVGTTRANQIIIGNESAHDTHAFIHGPLDVFGQLNPHGDVVAGGRVSGSVLSSDNIDSGGAATVLNIGPSDAGAVKIARTGVTTTVQGKLVANDILQIGHVQARLIPGDLELGDDNTGAVLIAKHGVGTEVKGHLIVDEDLSTAGSVSHNFSGSDHPAVTINQSSTTTTNPALDVSTNAQNTQGKGLKVTAAQAIEATGDVLVTGAANFVGLTTLSGNAIMTGKTIHQATLEMTGHDILMGGSGAGEVRTRYNNNRLEFLVGGTLRFYIDSTGGHNA